MKFSTPRDKLQRALSIVERVTSKNTTLPILNNLLMTAERGSLTVSATNLEVGVAVSFGAKVEDQGRIAVPARILTEFVKTATGDVISGSVKQTTLSVSSGGTRSVLLCFDAGEYPIIPVVKGGVEFAVNAAIFAGLLSSIIDSIAASDARPELSGAYLSIKDNTLTLAATDSFRLAEHRTKLTGEEDISIIIPRQTVSEILRVLEDISGDVNVHVAENQLSIAADGCTVVSRLIDGKYPDYRKVIPERSITRTLVRRTELEQAVKVAALFTSSISDVKLSCAECSLTVSGKNAAKGEGESTIDATVKGDAFDIALNYHYLLDGLRIMSAEHVVLEYTGKGSPFVIRPDDAEHVLVYIIMPLRG